MTDIVERFNSALAIQVMHDYLRPYVLHLKGVLTTERGQTAPIEVLRAIRNQNILADSLDKREWAYSELLTWISEWNRIAETTHKWFVGVLDLPAIEIFNDYLAALRLNLHAIMSGEKNTIDLNFSIDSEPSKG